MWLFGKKCIYLTRNMTNWRKWVIKIAFSPHIEEERGGVAILISNSVCFEFVSQHKDKEGRYILVKGKLEHKEVTFCNVYAPLGSDITFFRKIFNMIAAEAYGILIIAGDFNILLNTKLDTTNKLRRKNPIETEINKILQELGLIDIWRYSHRFDSEFTFYSARHNIHSRIDYFFIFNEDCHKVKEVQIGQRDISDHSSLYLKLQLHRKPKSTLWRLNTGLLNRDTFKSEMTEELKFKQLKPSLEGKS